MSNTHAHPRQASQSPEDLRGIGSWSEPRSMPSYRKPDKDLSRSTSKKQNPNNINLVGHLQIKQDKPDIGRGLQYRERVVTEKGDGVCQSSVSHKTTSIQCWLSEPAHQQPWNATSRIQDKEKTKKNCEHASNKNLALRPQINPVKTQMGVLELSVDWKLG